NNPLLPRRTGYARDSARRRGSGGELPRYRQSRLLRQCERAADPASGSDRNRIRITLDRFLCSVRKRRTDRPPDLPPPRGSLGAVGLFATRAGDHEPRFAAFGARPAVASAVRRARMPSVRAAGRRYGGAAAVAGGAFHRLPPLAGGPPETGRIGARDRASCR